ncbi:ubiquitin carboxyl-terminal hydrolase 26 [Nannospalax galili]|uniref:ubiquitin carboxyl-terminal hydrolase 26 n=1 Tax=Nannospalax galili TaxID=1026970 RepID=UPI0004ED39C8|nr:ubiquitin carboxyl-terminal hydrolase 26 [Nannospalax galili]
MDGILVHGHVQMWNSKTGMSKSKGAFIETVVGKNVRLQLYLNNGKVKTLQLKNNIKSVVFRTYEEDKNYMHLTFKNNDFLFIEKLASEDARMLKTFLHTIHHNTLHRSRRRCVKRHDAPSTGTQEFHDTALQNVHKKASSKPVQESETSVSQEMPLSAPKSPTVPSAELLEEQPGKRKRIKSPQLDKKEDEGVLKERSKESEAEPTVSVRENGDKRAELAKPETRKPPFGFSVLTGASESLSFHNTGLQVFIGNLLSTFLLGTDFIDKGVEWSDYLKTVLLCPDKTWQGLPNVGNTCYVNVVLQSLFSVPQFANDLFNQGFPWIKLPRDEFNMCLMQMLVLKDFYEAKMRETFLTGIQNALPAFGDIFAADRQNDAHEFLSLCLVQLKETIKKLNIIWQSECDSGANRLFKQIFLERAAKEAPVCPVASNFDSELLSSIFCKACGVAIIRKESSSYLSINIPQRMRAHTLSIQSSFDHFFKTEELEHTCEKCQHNRSVVVHKFSRLPRVIIIHLKRYIFTESRLLKKDDQQVIISKYLNLASHCNTDTKPPHPLSKNAHVKDTGLLKPLEELGSEIRLSLFSLMMGSKPKHFPTLNIRSKPQNLKRDCKELSGKQQQCDLGKGSTENVRPLRQTKTTCEISSGHFKKNEKWYTFRKFDSGSVSEPTKGQRFRISEPCQLAKQALKCQEKTNSEQILQQAITQIHTNRDAQKQTENITTPTDSESQSADPNKESSQDPSEKPEDKDVSDKKKSEAKVEPKATACEEEHIYRLIGVISHIGKSPHSGHYISDSFDFKKRDWFTYSDLLVSRIKEDYMQKTRLSTGYVFFYMHNKIFEELLAREEEAQSFMDFEDK